MDFLLRGIYYAGFRSNRAGDSDHSPAYRLARLLRLEGRNAVCPFPFGGDTFQPSVGLGDVSVYNRYRDVAVHIEYRDLPEKNQLSSSNEREAAEFLVPREQCLEVVS